MAGATYRWFDNLLLKITTQQPSGHLLNEMTGVPLDLTVGEAFL